MGSKFRIAIVHDWLNQTGGAEKVLEEMVHLFPEADIFTSIYAPDKMPGEYRDWSIHTSFMQGLPNIGNRHQHYMPLYPLAFRRFDLSAYDIVLSNKSGFCHGVNAANRYPNGSIQHGQGPIHICYCLTPTRFLWSFDQYREREKIGKAGNLLLQPLLPILRKWDHNAAQNVDFFIAISQEVQRRIKSIYGRESAIIHPPVDTDYFTPPDQPSLEDSKQLGNGSARNGYPQADARFLMQPSALNLMKQDIDISAIRPKSTPHQHSDIQSPNDVQLPNGVDPNDYYLIVSRLIPYKRIDIAIEAFRQFPSEKLIIVGHGRDRLALEELATENIKFLGRLERSQIRELLRYCKAFIFPGLEDFGIAPVEAMSVGRPVIAYAGGGALDTVVPGISGELFPEQKAESLLKILQTFDAAAYRREECRRQAEYFSVTCFRNQLFDYIQAVMCSNKTEATQADQRLEGITD